MIDTIRIQTNNEMMIVRVYPQVIVQPGAAARISTTVNLPTTYNTLRATKPQAIELTDADGYILSVPQQVDVRVYLDGTTWRIAMTSSTLQNVNLSYQ